ncbi:MAG: alkaline phosphatase family protein [Candidatus Omnitrophota bacterium]
MFLAYIDPGTGFTIFNLEAWLVAIIAGFFGIILIFLKNIFNFFKKHKNIFVFLLFFIACLTTGAFMNKGSRFDKKIIVLGFDGLSPDIVESMMKEGRLPNFSKLKEQGSYSRLLTTNPSQSPVAWAGFATGQNPGKNGIFDFIIRDPKTYTLNLAISDVKNSAPQKIIKSKCFWQYASEQNIPAVIISHPLTFPPGRIYGRMLSGMGVTDILGTEGTFTFYTTESMDKNKDVGGRVFQVSRAPVMVMNLIGPKVHTIGKESKNVKVPFKVTLEKDRKSAVIEFQNNKFELQPGEWSNWKEVSFKIGLFKTLKGIFKFYLVEAEPRFKLYISPINFDPRKPFFQISYPAGYSKELADNIGLYYTQGMPINTWAVNEKKLGETPLLEQSEMVLKERKAMLDFELKRFSKGILFCYFGATDTIQHMFWRYADPEHPLYEDGSPQKYKEAIENWYKKMDNILGDVMIGLNKNDTLIVLSDHGFNTFRRSAHINSWLRKNGYLELKNPYAKTGSELLTDIDWSKTRAYAIGFGSIYINQKGRERSGIVNPESDTELLKEEIINKLRGWRDEKYNQSVVNDVYKKEDIFHGKYAKNAPDLYIGFNIGYRASWQTALGAVPEVAIEDNMKKWSGDHLFDSKLVPGIIFSNKTIIKDKPSIYDIAPTILEEIGCGRGKIERCNFDGRPLFD